MFFFAAMLWNNINFIIYAKYVSDDFFEYSTSVL